MKYVLHIFRQRGSEIHTLSGDRMGEAQSIGVESLTGHIFHIRVVKIIADQRKAQILHMNADLVGAPGFQF